MATPLDLGLLKFFTPLFVWLFIFILIYAGLEKTRLLGDKSSALNLMAALSISALAVFYTKLTTLLEFITPWMVFIFIFLFILFMGLMFLGVEQSAIWKNLSVWTVLITSFIILLIAISQTYGDIFSPYGDGASGKSIGGEAQKTIFHPRVLGSLFLLIIIALSIRLIAGKIEGK